MKYLFFLFLIGTLVVGSCSATKQQNNLSATEQLSAQISIKPVIQSNDSLLLVFTVYNNSKTPQQFCKWHTPFERTMSKYLDIKDEHGIEAEYLGAMAKRIMPPPEDSYIKVMPGDSLQVSVDLFKDYKINKPGKYSIRYNAQGISGLIVKDSANFLYK